MPNNQPVFLGEIPSTDPDARLALFLISRSGENSVQLCQQSWAEGIGWFTQSSVEIETEQLGMLRQSLGTGTNSTRSTVRPAATSHPAFRIVG